MTGKTSIEWTDETWNPIRARRKDGTGKVGWACVRVSPGCVNCYAATQNRASWAGGTGLDYTVPDLAKVDVFIDDRVLEQPLHWREPRKVFVCSMTDLFGEWMQYTEIRRVFDVMRSCDGGITAATGKRRPRHIFQVLTKRAKRMRELAETRALGFDPARPPDNIWMGVSVENQEEADERIPHLLATPAAVRFLSCEPYLGPIDLTRFLSYDTSDDGCRAPVLGSDGPGDVLSRFRGANLAAPARIEREPSPSGSDHRGGTADPSGDGRVEGLSAVAVHGGRGAVSGLRPSNRVDGHEPFGHPRADRGQPQGRGRVEQSSIELGADDEGGEPTARDSRARSLSGDESSRREVDATAGGGDPRTLRREVDGTGADRASIRSLGEERRRDRQSEDVLRDSRLAPRVAWVIVGGESGLRARPMDLAWLTSLVESSRAAGVPVFVKQDNGPRPGMQGRIPDPMWLKEFPNGR